jgi:Bacterial membrane protein YfhO
MSVTRRVTPAGLAALALVVIVLATFAEALLPSRVLFERDILGYWYPHRAALTAALAEGSLPLWNPWIGFGAPFLADASASQLAYPPSWLLLPLPLPLQFDLLAVGHCLLAAAGAAALARRLRMGVLPAAVAGGSYALAGPFLSALGLYHHFAGASWMPWVLWALEGLLQRPGLRGALVLGAVAAVQLLAGSGDLVLMTALLALARVLLRLRATRVRGAAQLAPPLALAAALALSISAVQWLPTLERGLSGPRAAKDFRTQTYWSLHPASLVDLAVPRLVSESSLSTEERARLFEGREPLFACVYQGVLTLAFAGLALALRQPRAAPLAVGASALLLLSLGRHTPLYAWLLELPGFGLLRYPQKYLLPAALCLSLLAAAGAEAFARTWSVSDGRRARALAAALFALALLAVAAALRLPGDAGSMPGSLKLGRTAVLLAIASLLLVQRALAQPPRGRVMAVWLVLGAIDLVLVGRGTNPVAPAALYEHRPALVDRLRDAAGRFHAAAESHACLAPRAGPPGWEPSAVAALGFLDTLRPPSGIRWGLFGSFDGEFTGLGPRFTASFAGVVHAGIEREAALRLLQLGGVEHVLFLGGAAPGGFELLTSVTTPLSCPLHLLRVPDTLPRVYVVGREREEGKDALAAVLDPGFDPRREVVLPGAASTTGGGGGSASARIVSRTADTLQVAADLEGPGVLVVTEAYDEGWRAAVDGQPAELLRANGIFRAVRLAKGGHQVSFRYRPAAVRAGAAVSAVGVTAAVALGVALGRRGRV